MCSCGRVESRATEEFAFHCRALNWSGAPGHVFVLSRSQHRWQAGAMISVSPFSTALGVATFGFAAFAADDYVLAPESTERSLGVPAGRVEQFEFNESRIFPETRRDCWIYIPAQYDG